MVLEMTGWQQFSFHRQSFTVGHRTIPLSVIESILFPGPAGPVDAGHDQMPKIG